ncbi:MAG: efflux RND transporter periplasmic adaptor subunit [Pirellulales bacterium]
MTTKHLWAAAGTVGALTVLMLVLAGVFHTKVPDQRATQSRAGTSGPTAEVKLVSIPRVETAVGTIRAVHEASVASKLLARVLDVKVKAGQTVQQGDVLVQLDDADLQARVKQMESTLAAAQANLDRARSDQDRAQKLFEKSAISRAEFDQAVAGLKTSQAELVRSQQALEEARVMLDHATVRAPLSGVVIDKRVEPGDTAAPGQVLVSLYEPDRMQMVTTVRESLALRLNPGDEVPARLDSLGHECLATVSEVVPQAESASRSFTVKVTGPCPPGAYSGMFGRISIPLGEQQVLLVPAQAVLHVGQLELVDVVDGDAVRRRAIRTGKPHDDAFEVLSGLRAGDRVVLHSQEGAAP